MNKIATIFAGVNGVGKTTMYNLNFFNKENLGTRINTDEIVITFGDWRNEADQIKAGKIALKMRKDCIEKELPFNQETTLTGNSIIKFIKDIKSKGYEVHLFYIGVNSPKISNERIAGRVKKGGHFIPENIVEKRYYESLENFKLILPLVDYAEIYDNTYLYNLLMVKENNKIKVYEKNLPNWIKNINLEI